MKTKTQHTTTNTLVYDVTGNITISNSNSIPILGTGLHCLGICNLIPLILNWYVSYMIHKWDNTNKSTVGK